MLIYLTSKQVSISNFSHVEKIFYCQQYKQKEPLVGCTIIKKKLQYRRRYSVAVNILIIYSHKIFQDPYTHQAMIEPSASSNDNRFLNTVKVFVSSYPIIKYSF